MAPRTALSTSPGGLLLILPLVVAVLFLAYYLGRSPSLTYVAAPVAVVAGLAILRQQRLGLVALIVAALASPVKINTGTEVQLNLAVLLVPALVGIWLLGALLRGGLNLSHSRVNLPLMLFLLAGLVSLAIGNATWDPIVQRKDSFILVQLSQWAMFAFSAGAFWLMGNLVTSELWLRRITLVFLTIAGGAAILWSIPGLQQIVASLTPETYVRSPFWVLLAALAGGQLLFNRQANRWQTVLLLLVLGAVLLFVFVDQRDTASHWVSVTVVLGTLVWLRFPRIRGPIFMLIVLSIVLGIVFPIVWEFAGGDDEWVESGGSRVALTSRVIEVSLRNPITGLGPAAYRMYARMTPLYYEGAFYPYPNVSSHNNFVDLFSHVGVMGILLFLWFAVEIALLGLRLRKLYPDGFSAGYVNAMLAAGAAAITLMFFADWILPFVYNIGFTGFQASVLLWLFLGGLVALEQLALVQKGNS